MIVVEAEKQSLSRNLHAQFHTQNLAIKSLGGFEVAHPDSNMAGTLDRHCNPPIRHCPAHCLASAPDLASRDNY